MSGRIAFTASYEKPSLPIALPRIEWMKTSAVAISARSTRLPRSCRKSSMTLRLPRFTLT
jgi:hypothetical protein